MTGTSTPVADPGAALPPPPVLLLGRALQRRLGAVVLLVVVLLALADAAAWRGRLRDELPATTRLVTRALGDDLGSRNRSYNRFDLDLHLEALEPLAQRIPFCLEVHDITSHLRQKACLPARSGQRLDSVGRVLAGAELVDLAREVPLVQSEGIAVGVVKVEPHWSREAGGLLGDWAALGLAGLAMLLALGIASRLVARALAPANQVLVALGRLADGQLETRLPPMHLRELHRIGEAFNSLALQWSGVQRQQRALAQHLLQAREAERQKLARELHDEMGQSLTALQAEAAAMALMTAGTLPAAAAGAQAMARTTAQLLDGLQRVLADLRPQALDRFGLAQALLALVQLPRRRADGGLLQVRLDVTEPLPLLPADHDIHVYRIVQEALTNCMRHSGAVHVQVRLGSNADAMVVEVADDGTGHAVPPEAGRGLLGMRERVQALGGQMQWSGTATGGSLLRVRLPLGTGGGTS